MTLNKLQLTSLLIIAVLIGFGLGLGYQLWRTPKYAMSIELIQDSLGHNHIDTAYYVPHPTTAIESNENVIPWPD